MRNMKKKILFLIHDLGHGGAERKLAGQRHYVKESPKKFLTVLCIPAGYLLYRKIKQKGLLYEKNPLSDP
jgi:hypothetical protein